MWISEDNLVLRLLPARMSSNPSTSVRAANGPAAATAPVKYRPKGILITGGAGFMSVDKHLTPSLRLSSTDFSLYSPVPLMCAFICQPSILMFTL